MLDSPSGKAAGISFQLCPRKTKSQGGKPELMVCRLLSMHAQGVFGLGHQAPFPSGRRPASRA